MVADGPDQSQIASVTGHAAKEPLRVYVGLGSADNPRARAQLALAELQRVGAFERANLVIATPTGTGWVDEESQHALEYLLFLSIPRADTNALAHRLIQHFGDFCKVLEAEPEELMRVEGVGPKSARLISTVMACSRYYELKKRKTRLSLNSAEAAIAYVKPLFRGVQNEQLYLILLDDACRPVQDLRIAEGVPNRVAVDTRKLLRTVARTNSTCGILAHNHPTGLAIPSEADRLTTYHIMEVTGQLGFTIMDHIIIAGEDGCSMLNRGSLPEYRANSGVLQAAGTSRR